MEEFSFLTQTLSVLFLLTISSFTYIFSKKINFPYTVLLVLVGLFLIPLSHIPFFGFIDDFRLTPDILFFVFLPVLLFEAAYNINYKHLLKSWKVISSLAIVGLLISTIIIAVGLYFLFPFVGLDVPFLVCLLFGSLISATDPVAVLSIFKSLGAPRKLALIFEGESLFNDGTAVALFLVILGVITEGGGIVSGSTYLTGVWSFISMLFGGILFGIFTGVVFSKIIGYIRNHEEVEIVLTMLLAHITFILAEVITHHFHYLPISGVIATVVASIVIGNYGRYKITPKVELHMQKFWEFFAFVSNSIVFILLGLILSSVEGEFLKLMVPLLISIPVIMFARAVSVYLPIGIINALGVEERISMDWQHLLSWGSLRGALAIMMVLMIPGVGDPGYGQMMSFQQSVGWVYDYSIKDFLIILTITNIMFTLFVKAPTISVIMKRMGVDRLHDLEKFEYEEGKILANFKILEKLNNSYKKAYLTKNEYDDLTCKYTDKLNEAVISLKAILSGCNKTEANTLIRRAISMHALGIEKQYLKKLFMYNEIDERNFKYIFRKIDKQMERIEDESPQLRKISSTNGGYDFFARFTMSLYKNSSSYVDTYIRNRARLIITRKVIKELRALKQIDFGFEKEIFDETIDLYAIFNKVADEKRIAIFVNNKTTIMGVEAKLVNKSLMKLEEQVIIDLYQKEIITPKLYIKFMEEVEEELYSDIKKIV